MPVTGTLEFPGQFPSNQLRVVDLLGCCKHFDECNISTSLTAEVGGGGGSAPSGSFVVSNGAIASAKDTSGTIPVVSGGRGRRQIGRVRVRASAVPAPPPPTLVRFGDVGVAPAGCPMCPVLDDQVPYRTTSDQSVVDPPRFAQQYLKSRDRAHP
jgi:hypothetical protein